MLTTKERLKARLLEQYENRLDQLLAELDPAEALHLTEIEEAALALRQRTGEDVTRAMVESQTQVTTPDEACPRCGRRQRYKGKKRKYLRTRSGEMDIQRPYYYCAACRQGHFPPR